MATLDEIRNLLRDELEPIKTHLVQIDARVTGIEIQSSVQ
jgi:hypothetical protein